LECGDVLGGEVGVCHEGELAVAGLVGFDIVDEVAGDVVEPEIVGDVDGFGAEDGDLDGLAEITAAGHFRSGCLGRAVRSERGGCLCVQSDVTVIGTFLRQSPGKLLHRIWGFVLLWDLLSQSSKSEVDLYSTLFRISLGLVSVTVCCLHEQ